MTSVRQRRVRRDRGMFRRKGSPYWWFDYTDQSGIRRRVSSGIAAVCETPELTQHNQKMAAQRLSDLKGQVDAETIRIRNTSSAITLAEFTTKYDRKFIQLETTKNKSGPAQVINDLAAFLGNGDPEVGGRTLLAAITPVHLQDFQDAMLADGNRPSSVRTKTAYLRAMFRRAMKWKDLHATPYTLDVEKPKKGQARVRTRLSREDADRLHDALEGDTPAETAQVRALYQFCLRTLTRLNNGLELRRDAVQAGKHGAWYVTLDDTKNGEVHMVRISPDLKRLLDGLGSKGTFYFPALRAAGLLKSTRRRRVALLCRDACARASAADPERPIFYGQHHPSKRGITWHRATRATGACLLLEGDEAMGIPAVSRNKVRDIGGWKSMEEMEAYLGTLPDELDEAVALWPLAGRKSAEVLREVSRPCPTCGEISGTLRHNHFSRKAGTDSLGRT